MTQGELEKERVTGPADAISSTAQHAAWPPPPIWRLSVASVASSTATVGVAVCQGLKVFSVEAKLEQLRIEAFNRGRSGGGFRE
jgi:hypothetical protein